MKHQQEPFEKFLEKGYIYLTAPTGWGKSYFAMKAIEDFQGGAIIVCPAHLVKQWSKYLKDNNIPFGVNNFEDNIVIYSIAKLTRDLKTTKNLDAFRKFLAPKLFVIDEYHRVLGMTSNIYRSLQRVWAKKYMFLSATPFERGVQDLYPALRINYILNIKKNWGDSWRSVTSFKQFHCVMGGFENRIIKSVFESARKKMLNEITMAQHTKGEGELATIEAISVDTEQADKIIKEYKAKEDYHFATARTILNGFRYVETPEGKEIQWLFVSQKIAELKSLIKAQKGKALLFLEFIAEKEQLKGIKNLKFYDKKKYNVEDFKNDATTKVMAVHYRSLGEGVRVKFVDTIYMFTVSISNRMKTQAIGRAIFAGRTKGVKVYEFTTKTSFERRILQKLNDKETNVKELFKEALK